MIVRPNLQCKSPYFHGLWYFYLSQRLVLPINCPGGLGYYNIVQPPPDCVLQLKGNEVTNLKIRTYENGCFDSPDCLANYNSSSMHSRLCSTPIQLAACLAPLLCNGGHHNALFSCFLAHCIRRTWNLVIAHPHLLVWATSERFLPAWVTFGASFVSESHWLQPMPVLTVHYRPALVSVGGLLVKSVSFICKGEYKH